MIKNENEERLYEYIGGILRGLGGILLMINGVEDHVHILAKLRPDKALSDVLRDLKSNASRMDARRLSRCKRLCMAEWLCCILSWPDGDRTHKKIHFEPEVAPRQTII